MRRSQGALARLMGAHEENLSRHASLPSLPAPMGAHEENLSRHASLVSHRALSFRTAPPLTHTLYVIHRPTLSK